jgi:hypothetical protein
MVRSLFSEGIPNLGELFGLLLRDGSPKTLEHLEGGMAGAVEELKAERLFAAEMAGLHQLSITPFS